MLRKQLIERAEARRDNQNLLLNLLRKNNQQRSRQRNRRPDKVFHSPYRPIGKSKVEEDDKKKPPKAIAAYFFYQNDTVPKIKFEDSTLTHQEAVSKAAELWATMSDELKEPYQKRHAEDQER